MNRNWQDLGRLVLDAKLFDYDENPSYYAYKRDNNANYLAVGGEMPKAVTLNDLMATFLNSLRELGVANRTFNSGNSRRR